MNDDYLFIDDHETLRKWCERLRPTDFVCLDTEFIRERTYYPKLCLIQIRCGDRIACIDPLAVADLGPLLDILFDPAICKVLHAARQDLELFYHLTGRIPAPLFDTQTAAALLGLPEQVGYAALVRKLLGVSLDKTHARTDWSARPLSPQQLRYAADDVRYLAEAYLKQLDVLRASGKLPWLREDFELLTDIELYQPQPEQAWRRIKEAHRLRPAQRTTLAALAAWRERLAMQTDKPRQWVLKDDVLVEVARKRPEDRQRLEAVRGMERGWVQRRGDELLKVIRQAANDSAPSLDAAQRPPELDVRQEALVDAMSALIRLRASEHGINPGLLATRGNLQRIASGGDNVRVLQGWRGALVGRDLEALQQGKVTLQVIDGTLVALYPS